MIFAKQGMAFVLSASLLFSTGLETAAQDTTAQDQSAPASPTPVAQQTPEQLQQLVAPIALYPDALVAQILAASTYPTEVVEADRWLDDHKKYEGKKLAEEVDKQHWDPSVKALIQFPSVLGNLDKNLEWTSSLGDAYVNQQQDVMDAVQAMRAKAQTAGNLKTTSQETVSQEGKDIEIQPVDPEVVYVPEYDPWTIYGGPLVVWPGWYGYPGLYIDGPGIGFGVGFGLGFFGGYGWGWGGWGFNWGGRSIIYNHTTYISHSTTFMNRNGFGRGGRGGFDRGSGFGRESRGGFGGGERGFGSSRASGVRSGAFSGFGHGGSSMRAYSRGSSSFGGGFHGGGGGGFHGGGGGRR